MTKSHKKIIRPNEPLTLPDEAVEAVEVFEGNSAVAEEVPVIEAVSVEHMPLPPAPTARYSGGMYPNLKR